MTFLLLTEAFDFGTIFGNVLKEWYYYLVLAIFIFALVLFFVFKKPNKRNSLSPTQKIVYTAVLCALCVAANCFTYYPVSFICISFTYTVCFVAGYLLGARAGFAVGFIGDMIGGIIAPSGAYNPLIGLSSGLIGFIAGFVYDYFKGNAYVKACVFAVASLIICTSGLNTFALWLMYGLGKKSFWAYLIARLPWQLLVCAANLALCCALAAILPKVLPKCKFFPNGLQKEAEKDTGKSDCGAERRGDKLKEEEQGLCEQNGRNIKNN